MIYILQYFRTQQYNQSVYILIMNDKFKKQVGFIKNSSSKKNINRLAGSPSSSSGSFSSFEYNPQRERHEQFSPYKHPIPLEESFRPHSNHKPNEERNRIIVNKHSNQPPKFSNQILRNNFIQEANQKAKQIHLGKEQKRQVKGLIRQNRRQYMESHFRKENQNQKNQNDDFEEELSLSNIHKFQKSKISQKEEAVDYPQNKKTKQLPKYKNYIQQSPSQSDESAEQNLQQKATVKSPRRRVHDQDENEEQLIIEYDKRQFKDKSIKRAILQQQNQRPAKIRGTIEAKGGLCFELDTRQFKGNPKATNFPKKKKKKAQVDERLLLIQRRQMAKMYDRQARVKVFGYY